MPAKTSVRINTRLVDEVTKVLGVQSRTAAVHTAVKEVVALHRFKKLMKKHAGKLEFQGFARQSSAENQCPSVVSLK